MTIAVKEGVFNISVLLLLLGFILGWTRYRRAGGQALIAGFLLVIGTVIFTLHDTSRFSTPPVVLIFLQIFWNVSGTAALLLRRLGQTGWQDLVTAVGLRAAPVQPAGLARLGEVCYQAREASLQVGLMFFGVAAVLFLGSSLDGSLSRLHLYLGSTLMPMTFAFLISEWRFGTLEQHWRRQLPLDHPNRFGPPVSRWWFPAILYCGLLFFAWATFAESGIPQRWMP